MAGLGLMVLVDAVDALLEKRSEESAAGSQKRVPEQEFQLER